MSVKQAKRVAWEASAAPWEDAFLYSFLIRDFV